MAGFAPVGSTPVASIGGASAPSLAFTPATGRVVFASYAPLMSYAGNPVRVTWFAAEALTTGDNYARVSWFAIEALTGPEVVDARISWFAAEVLNDGDPANAARATWMAAEMINDGDPNNAARVTWMAIEAIVAAPTVDRGFLYLIPG